MTLNVYSFALHIVMLAIMIIGVPIVVTNGQEAQAAANLNAQQTDEVVDEVVEPLVPQIVIETETEGIKIEGDITVIEKSNGPLETSEIVPEAIAQEQTEAAATQASTEDQTEAPTEAKTEAPTEAPIEPPTEATTEAEVEKVVSYNQEMCNAYADGLLAEGVITEEEAAMLKERGNGPEKPWISNVSETVIGNLADVMYAEAGSLISLEGWTRGKRALLLVGSVVCNRYHYPTLGDCSTLNEIISYRGAYASRTRNRMGKRYYISDGYDFIEDWARDLYTYGPIGPRTLIWQGPKQGKVYDEIHGEFFGLDKNPPF